MAPRFIPLSPWRHPAPGTLAPRSRVPRHRLTELAIGLIRIGYITLNQYLAHYRTRATTVPRSSLRTRRAGSSSPTSGVPLQSRPGRRATSTIGPRPSDPDRQRSVALEPPAPDEEARARRRQLSQFGAISTAAAAHSVSAPSRIAAADVDQPPEARHLGLDAVPLPLEPAAGMGRRLAGEVAVVLEPALGGEAVALGRRQHSPRRGRDAEEPAVVGDQHVRPVGRGPERDPEPRSAQARPSARARSRARGGARRATAARGSTAGPAGTPTTAPPRPATQPATART